MSVTGPRELILVPNNASLQMCQAERFLATGAAAIEAPAVDVFSLWVGACLETNALLLGREVRAVPEHFRLQGVWERVIAERTGANWLPADIAAVAHEAMEADRLLSHWLEAQDAEPGRAGGSGAFAAWRAEAARRLGQAGWHPPAEQLRRFAELLEEDLTLPAALPAEIALRGFIELTDLERRVLRGLERHGVVVSTGESNGASEDSALPPVRLHRYRSIEDELRGAARWAQDRLEQGDQRVAVAVNDLDAWREVAGRVFLQQFHPSHALAATVPVEATFHLQGGTALADHPLAREALELLALAVDGVQRPVSFQAVSRWLLSPAWAAADTERAARASLELHLRRRKRTEWTLAALADEATAFPCPVLVERVSRLPGALADLPDDSGSARRLFAWLQHWGWPGPLAHGPLAHRVVDRMRQSLEAIDVAGVGDDAQAVAALRGLVRRRRLAGAGGALSPVQLMALDDVVGQRFDAVRVVNVHADNWPAPVRLNRVLPFAAARRLPRSDSAGQRAFARRVLEGILGSTSRVEFSWSEQVEGVPTAASALIPGAVTPDSELPEASGVAPAATALAAWPGAGGPATDRDRLTVVPRRHAGDLGDGPERLDGAVSVLNLQAACPWAAFLVHRLHAVFPDPPSPFPDLSFTGTLVHEALRCLYRAHAGQGTLPGPGDITSAVAAALEVRRAERVLAPAVLAVEERRVAALLEEWLAFERSLPWPRPQALEAEREAEVAGYAVRIRMDRLDSLDDGVLILDYKTGRPVPPNWADDRPTDWQLPLYSVLGAESPSPVLGVGLLSVRSHDMKQQIWTGIDAIRGKGVVVMGGSRSPFPDWPAALAHWRGALDRLLGEYRAGVADFTVHHEKPLDYLGLDPLLRGDWAVTAEEAQRD